MSHSLSPGIRRSALLCAAILAAFSFVFAFSVSAQAQTPNAYVMANASCSEAKLTFIVTHNTAWGFEYRVDGAPGTPDFWTTFNAGSGPGIIHGGPLAGTPWGNKYQVVNFPAAPGMRSQTVTLPFPANSGTHHVSYRLVRGAENNWYFDWKHLTVNTDCAYDAIPSPLPENLGSYGWASIATTELGDHIALAGTDRRLESVTMLLSVWACQTGATSTTACATTPGATFTHPFTLNIYEAPATLGALQPGPLVKSVTKTLTIPYRPSADPTCPVGSQPAGAAWRSPVDGVCYTGYATTVTFTDLLAENIVLDDNFVYGIVYSTDHYGPDSAILGPGPYDATNIGILEVAPSIGADHLPDGVYWNTTSGPNANTFSLDTGWTDITLAVEFNTVGPECTTDCYVNAALGSDINPGTTNHPKATIQGGVNAVSAGGTVYVSKGSYSGNVVLDKQVNIVGPGYTYTAAGNDPAVMSANSAIFTSGIQLNSGASGSTIDGLAFVNPVTITGDGIIRLLASNNITVKNNLFSINISKSAIWTQSSPGPSNGLQVLNNVFYNPVDSSRCLYLADASNVVVANNDFGRSGTSVGCGGGSQVATGGGTNDVYIHNNNYFNVRALSVGAPASGIKLLGNNFTGYPDKAVSNNTVNTVDARLNWWGTLTPGAAQYSGPVDWAPTLLDGIDVQPTQVGFQPGGELVLEDATLSGLTPSTPSFNMPFEFFPLGNAVSSLQFDIPLGVDGCLSATPGTVTGLVTGSTAQWSSVVEQVDNNVRVVIAPVQGTVPLPTFPALNTFGISLNVNTANNACITGGKVYTLAPTAISCGANDGITELACAANSAAFTVSNAVPFVTAPATTVAENAVYNGTFTVFDSDGNAPTWSISNACGANTFTHNGLFSIDQTTGVLTLPAQDFEMVGPDALKVCVTVDDGRGGVVNTPHTVSVTNVAEWASGDCNMSGVVNATDVSATVLEIFDQGTSSTYGTDNTDFNWLTAPYGDFRGSPEGCDSNAGTIVGAADMACTVRIIFGDTCPVPDLTDPTVDPSSAQSASLSIPADLGGDSGVVAVPVSLNAQGYDIVAATFTLKLNPAVVFDSTDANGDGIPDAIAFHVPESMLRMAVYNAEQHAVKVAVAGLSMPFTTIDGTIVTVTLPRTTTAGNLVQLEGASVGNALGQDVPLELMIGDVAVQSFFMYFLPNVTQ